MYIILYVQVQSVEPYTVNQRLAYTQQPAFSLVPGLTSTKWPPFWNGNQNAKKPAHCIATGGSLCPFIPVTIKGG